MKSELAFPIILIVLQFFAAFGYIPKRDWWMVLYWIAAAILNIAVTFKR